MDNKYTPPLPQSEQLKSPVPVRPRGQSSGSSACKPQNKNTGELRIEDDPAVKGVAEGIYKFTSEIYPVSHFKFWPQDTVQYVIVQESIS